MLVHFINAASIACQKATIVSTKTKQASAFKCWSASLIGINIHNLFLDRFSRFQQYILMSAFAQAMQEAISSSTKKEELVEGTVCATLSYVAQAFQADNRSDPRLDIEGKTCFIL